MCVDVCMRNTSFQRLNPTSTAQNQHRPYWQMLQMKCPFRWSRSTHTDHTDIGLTAIELCFMTSARLLFKAAGQQLILIRVDGAGRTTTNQHIYAREWVYEPLTLSTLKSLYCRVEIMSVSESSLISTFDFFLTDINVVFVFTIKLST